jgi:hypothetical protein
MTFEAKRVVFISAYKALADALNRKGVETIFIPMSIDVEKVKQFAGEQTTDRLLWFGNVDRPKRETFNALRSMTEMDVIAGGKFNGEPVTQEDAWAIASGYRYGIAVGRCALELYALGIRVLIAGTRCGGLVMTEEDARRQEETNYTARYATHSADLATCLEDLPDSIIPEVPDIRTMSHADYL